MPDIVSPETRSRMMAGIRGRDTKPELAVRRYLDAQGFRYRLHARELPGRPDIVLPRHRAVVLVHGCFWHQHPECRFAYRPKSRAEFWAAKLEANTRRDRRDQSRLRELGWAVHVIWECELRDDALRTLVRQLSDPRQVPRGHRRES